MAGVQCVVAMDTTSAGELAEETGDTRSPAARRVKSLPQGHDVGYGETRDGDGRVPRHRPADCGMPVDVAFPEYAGYMVSSGRRRSKGTEERVLALMMSPSSSSRDKLLRTMLLCLSRPGEDWLHGEIDAFDSHEQVRSGLRKSQTAATLV